MCRVRYEGREVSIDIPLPGRYNVSNALAAAGLALAAGLDLKTIGAALARAAAPPGRMQRVAEDGPIDVVIDYAHTPNAFRSVLSALRGQLQGGRLIAVFGAAGNRDRQKRPELARIALAHTDFFYITNEDPFGEDPAEIIGEIASGVSPEDEGRRFLRIPDRGDAIRRAIAAARPGDVVAILGKGHEQSIAVGNRKEAWSDLAAARRALEERA
jgi:UDP-N-acetylmuramoyl-L-alanyl-D-glutamate--2,6-diaminopimelate ligase